MICSVSATDSKAKTTRKIYGSIYVTTRGNGAYRFSGVTVILLPRQIAHNFINAAIAKLQGRRDEFSIYKAWSELLVDMVRHGEMTTSDGDGHFEFTVPKADGLFPYYVFASATRLIGDQTEYDTWMAGVRIEGPTNLSESNFWFPPT
ncbi:MAG TPA: hypothetical protein VL200_08160 [Lacunisphaera sp.]|jgi:hypothetical protein|nr:hypothetical protein [Lacunisphaera sp.]